MDENKAHYVVATCIVVKDGRYLITKRAEWEKHWPGRWTVPGGKLETKDYNTLPQDTAAGQWYNITEKVCKREVKEEAGIEIKDIKYLASLVFVRPDGIPTLVLSMYADYESGKVSLSEDMSGYAWVSLEEAKNFDLIEGIYEEIEMLDRHLKGDKLGEWKKN